ncbi:molybdate ABC transporter substrate-binding protein [Microbulbifer pacificus]|uniref:Molybdate ABC transporter substrate-binding protein n=1 Tax=Microbulbifer pacificus TaxID=407164 RepID=A0AAU0MY26_9GAMM|nr:molybdate ABC transporter substrate-binding protein [Microbulbifer pacificus]WOX05585.1 molybdate ABC transporter substrate-binding protein [Microbulbifer pacificus]
MQGSDVRAVLGRVLLLFPLFFSIPSQADELTLAVASNFTAPMQEIARRFEQRSGHRVKLAFGSSGKFFAQISHGAPYHAFFSADQAKPAQLVKLGLADAGSRFTYAEGRLALWSSKPGFVDAAGEVLKHGDYNKLAIANPKLAPYGAAAVELLQQLQLEEQTRARRVQGENISQTYQFVATGNADLGLVALSQILKDGKVEEGSAWIVPVQLYSPIRQDAVVLKRGEHVPALEQLWAYMHSAEVSALIRSYGYGTPSTLGGDNAK